MRCMKCGAVLTDSAYCPACGMDVSVQKQAIVLSGIYYNEGLEKAQVRDLSGAIDRLKRSLKFNKLNIDARNLLGLAYFETGEVVAALSEWVISKNIQPEGNIAAEYIRNLQQDANRLDIINQTIKKYNLALENCIRGNDDVALIQLKKILAQNPKLIKGYHLLALLHIHRQEYEKARKLLKKAIQIDKTNTTTLRFLQEVDEQTGKPTSLEGRISILPGRRDNVEPYKNEDVAHEIQQPAGGFQGSKRRVSIASVIAGILIGAAAIWFLFIPSRMRAINRQANEKVTKYSSDMAVYAAQIETMNDQILASQETVNTANEQIEQANSRATSYDNLVKATTGYRGETYTTAANALAAVDPNDLSVDARAQYDFLIGAMASSMTTAFKKAGIEAFNTGDYDKAIEKLTLSYASNETDYETLNYLAHSYRMKGDTAKSDELFQKIIDENPGSQIADNARQYLSTSGNAAPAANAPAAANADASANADDAAEDTDNAAEDQAAPAADDEATEEQAAEEEPAEEEPSEDENYDEEEYNEEDEE